MCTVVILRRPWHRWPLILAANRDEMKHRPWRSPARHWPDHPNVVAGLDELAGGSWLGLNDDGVVAAVLNQVGSLGPTPGKRSRGELILRALDEPNIESAASAITALNPNDFRSYNLVIADRNGAVWLRHEGGNAGAADHGIKATRVGSGLSMITARELNDTSSPRITAYLPRFKAARPPDPEQQQWNRWQALLANRKAASRDDPTAAMTVVTGQGFETTSSSIIALPGTEAPGNLPSRRPIWRFSPGRPDRTDYQEVQF